MPLPVGSQAVRSAPKRRFCICVRCGVLVVLVVVVMVVAAVERAIQRSDIGQLDLVPDLLLPEEPVAG